MKLLSKVLFVGGQDKGWGEPFSEHTRSGKVLRALVSKLGIDAAYLDLWEDEKMEQNWPYVTRDKFEKIYKYREDGYDIIGLGGKVMRAMIECDTWFPTPLSVLVDTFLPHPAARRSADQQRLADGLKRFVNRKGDETWAWNEYYAPKA